MMSSRRLLVGNYRDDPREHGTGRRRRRRTGIRSRYSLAVRGAALWRFSYGRSRVPLEVR